mmetsp:Transcript_9965/g.25565  ORF Transcript_9965/g.25565 Transcript_9965/m.25565 type:complete len:186 (+) Transcript_9965:80-637(+)
MRLCDEECPTVLLVESTAKDRFGAFLTNPWTERYRQNGHYFGNGDCFVFSLGPEVKVYPWVGLTDVSESDDDDAGAGAAGAAEVGKGGVPSLFMYATDDVLAVGGGGGGHAIQLDEQLKDGLSQPCATFGNPGLLTKGDAFTCARVEVWSFSPRGSPIGALAGADAHGTRGVAGMMAGLTSKAPS